MRERLKKIFKPRIKLVPGTRLISFLFIGLSVIIAAGILIAANIYYNIDTGEIVMEQINRVTQVIRATGGLIVGGSATQNPESGYSFQVVGSTKLATTTIATGTLELITANQELRFTGGTNYYIGFKAPTNITSTKVYILPQHGTSPPQSDYVLTWQSGDQLQWKPATELGLVGDISAVGNVTSGEAFTATGTGSTLWFHSGSYTGALTIASLSANATFTLPAVSGTNYLTLASSFPFSQGQVLYADSNGLITGGSNLSFDASNRIFSIGSTGGNGGQLRIYSSNASGYYLGFGATSSMTETTFYWWPTSIPTNADTETYILRTDASGNLTWTTVSGAGGVSYSGTPSAGQVAYFVDQDTITGSSNFTWSTSTNTLTINGALTVSGTSTANLFTGPSGATTTIISDQDILLDPATGKVVLGSSDWIETASGYQIGKTGTQVLKEMAPIMGFDLPVRTATSGTVTISRTIESYPFSSCSAGTSRIHKLVIRYGSMGTTTWEIATSGGPVATFTVPATNSTASGTVYTYQVTIPTPAGSCTGWSQGTDTDDWWVRISPSSNDTMIYQIFLAAYDQIL